MTTTRPYHHGNLRQAVLTAAVAAIDEAGPAALSLRDVARRAGVSHAAPAHHFHDKAGVFTAVAVDGFTLLAKALSAAAQQGGFQEVGVSYVRFALEHRAHFEVMYRPDLYRADDPAVRAAREAAGRILYSGASTASGAARSADAHLAGVAAWSLMHGFATLWINHTLPGDLGPDPETVARSLAQLLFPAP